MTIRLGNKIISGGGSSGVPGWTGTLAEYNALTEIDDEMLYYITDDCLDSNSNHLGGLDIGDIGFTALGVNEELNCRRYLNGQVLAMDEFPEFTSKLKHAVSLNSSIAVDEDVWQTELAMSANGICYKFVIDDNNMTIRLPKYPEYFIAGLSDSTGVAGNGISIALTDNSQSHLLANFAGNTYRGIQYVDGELGSPIGQSWEVNTYPHSGTLGLVTDPSKSGIEALVDSASEKVYGFYFIQVANGLEQTVDITREITLNNPFFLGMYQYFEVEPNNISWLKSEGQWNSAEVYPGMWEWLLEQYNRGLKQTYWWHDGEGWIALTLKETPEVGDTVYGALGTAYGKVTAYDSTANTITLSYDEGATVTIPRNASKDIVRWVEDEESVIRVTAASDLALYGLEAWFVINTEDNTFRLPTIVRGASGKAVAGNGKTLGFYGLNSDGSISNFGSIKNTNNNFTLGLDAYGQDVKYLASSSATSSQNGYIGVTQDPSKSGIETSTEGLHLYFYVGETVQDPTLINVGRLTHALSLKTDAGQAAHAAMPSSESISITVGVTDTDYVAPADGYMTVFGTVTTAGGWLDMLNKTNASETGGIGCYYKGNISRYNLAVSKGDIINITYSGVGTLGLIFTYANGSQPTN